MSIRGGSLHAPHALTHTHSLSADALNIQQKLDETTKLLRDLQEAQKERLSAKQPPNMICLLAPSAKELELGESLDLGWGGTWTGSHS